MLGTLRWAFWVAVRALLSLRYRVTVTGLDSVRGLRRALIMPNHPGYAEPALVLATLWPVLRPRPMVLASMFRNPLIFWVPGVLDAVEIPDLQEASASARQQTEASVQVVIQGLQAGNNHIVWPAGRVYHRAGRESLGATRAVSDILQAVPDAEIVLVRTRGLWGSLFSYARTGRPPAIAARILEGVGILLSNLLFFTPRRDISITIERVDRARLPGLTRDKLNPFLEAWYNAPGDEPPKHVPYHFLLGSADHVFPSLEPAAGPEPSRVAPATLETVAQIVAQRLKREPTDADRQAGTKLEDLGLDSLERMEISLEIERRFGFSSDEVPATVGALWALAEGAAKTGPALPVPGEWFRSGGTRGPAELLADTMAAAFVERALTGSLPAVADDMSGVVTYERLLVGALLLARRFGSYPEPNVGILLPASVAADTVFFALHLAGKLPVVLNFTTGPANLAHAARVAGLRRVVTSRRFVDRIGITIEGAEYVHLEELRSTIGRVEALGALLKVRFAPGAVRRAVPPQRPDDPAVVLFTSGSEKAPKAVPLTHANITSNIRAILGAFHVTGDDSVLGFLPPFHSFGLTVTMILPVLAGARVVHHPDPTDATSLARKASVYATTILCATPTFISYILDRAKAGDLDHLRLLVAGAEKCPERVFEKGRRMAPRARILEGYGITECAPVVSANREAMSKPGSIGLPLSNVKVRVVDVDDHTPLPVGREGMLLVHGPNVFPGYLGEGPDPFVVQDGLRWYVTGDLVRIDEDGFLWFAGRLKRFLKAGGEMISLPALEEPFTARYPPTDQGPRVAVEGIETPTGRRIVLFSTEPVTLREANELLHEKGFRGIMRLDEVRPVEKIPVLGTGKTDYKLLRAWVDARPEGGAA